MTWYSLLQVCCVEFRERHSLSIRFAKLGTWGFGTLWTSCCHRQGPDCRVQPSGTESKAIAPRTFLSAQICLCFKPVPTIELSSDIILWVPFSLQHVWIGSLSVWIEMWVGSLTKFFYKVVYFIKLRNFYFCLSVLNFSLRSDLFLFVFNICEQTE